MNLEQIQEQLKKSGIDGWLFFDHHLRDPISYRVLGLAPNQHVTRRWYYLIPAEGEPRKLVHRIESRMLDLLPGSTDKYSSWAEQERALAILLRGSRSLAMQYSPMCAIPYISMVDGGTIDLIRSMGIEVVSSAELIQHFEARLNETAMALHLEAGRLVDDARRKAFAYIRESLRANRLISEWDVAEFLRKRFDDNNLVTDSGPIVAVDRHAGDPHYEPSREGSFPIRPGSLVLIDMWAKLKQPGAIFYDITWTGFCGASVPGEIERVFEIVRDARDVAIRFVKQSFQQERQIRGFEVDDVTRSVIGDAGYGENFVHRTGHSIGEEIHANGANMDNLETHDERIVIPWSCFSIEPGIYLDHFGIRSEVDMFVDATSARVTGEIQNALVLID